MDRRIWPLPGEISVATSWQSGEVSRGRSSGWIRAVTVRIKAEVLQAHEGPNVEVFQMPLGSPAARWGSPAISGTEHE